MVIVNQRFTGSRLRAANLKEAFDMTFLVCRKNIGKLRPMYGRCFGTQNVAASRIDILDYAIGINLYHSLWGHSKYFEEAISRHRKATLSQIRYAHQQ
jgi:hypothetical protein